MENDFDKLAEKYIGPDYASLKPQERLSKIFNLYPKGSFGKQQAKYTYTLPDNDADEFAYELMSDLENLDKMIEKYRMPEFVKLKTEIEKNLKKRQAPLWKRILGY